MKIEDIEDIIANCIFPLFLVGFFGMIYLICIMATYNERQCFKQNAEIIKQAALNQYIAENLLKLVKDCSNINKSNKE